MANVDVLPPGHGRVVEVDVVGFMPIGRDVLFDFFDGSVSQTYGRNLTDTRPGVEPEKIVLLCEISYLR